MLIAQVNVGREMVGPQPLKLRIVPRPRPTAARFADTVANHSEHQNNMSQFLSQHLTDMRTAITDLNGQVSGGVVLPWQQAARVHSYQYSAAIAPHVGDMPSQPSAVSYDGPLSFSAAPQGMNSTYGYVRWVGWLFIATAGTYNFAIQSTDGANLFVNQTQVIGALTTNAAINLNGNVTLSVGPVPIVAEWQWGTDAPAFALKWTPPSASQVLIRSSVMSPSMNTPAMGFLVGWYFVGSAAIWHP
jgi:hypothetical protein